jgi:hypothetical protein
MEKHGKLLMTPASCNLGRVLKVGFGVGFPLQSRVLG